MKLSIEPEHNLTEHKTKLKSSTGRSTSSIEPEHNLTEHKTLEEPIYARETNTIEEVRNLIKFELEPKKLPPTLEVEQKYISFFDPKIILKTPSKNLNIFKLGGKALLVYNYTYEFATIIVRSEKESIPGETTSLYEAAKKEMFKIAKKERKVVPYYFRSANPHMISWAKTKGKNIFKWTKIIPGDKQNPSWIFHAKINPFIKSN